MSRGDSVSENVPHSNTQMSFEILFLDNVTPIFWTDDLTINRLVWAVAAALHGE